MRKMTWAEVCARRLARHSLVKPSTSMIDVAGQLCGVHAQVMSAAELAIGLRVAGTTRADVRSALWEERSLVKTFGPRGTVHLFPANHWATWSSALAATPWQKGSSPPALRMSDEQIDTLIEAISASLEAASLDAAELTIDELDKAVVKHAGAWAGELVMPAFDGMWPRWRLIMTQAAYRGVLCFGPNRGRKVTYTNPRRLIPGFAPVDTTAALQEIVLRYLRTYGPATSQHFAQWLNIVRGGAAELFESVADRLEEVEVEGIRAFLPVDDDEPSTAADGLRLLPYFDAYSVGCHPRELVFPGRAAERGLSRGQAGTVQVVLIDGIVSGVWHQRRSGRKIDITVEPFAKLTAKRLRELDDQIERIGEILEGKPAMTIGTVTARSHL